MKIPVKRYSAITSATWRLIDVRHKHGVESDQYVKARIDQLGKVEEYKRAVGIIPIGGVKVSEDLKLVGFYATEEEKNQITSEAALKGLTVSAYIRQKIFGKVKGKTALRGRPKKRQPKPKGEGEGE